MNYDYIVPLKYYPLILNYHTNTYFNETLRCDTGVVHYITCWQGYKINRNYFAATFLCTLLKSDRNNHLPVVQTGVPFPESPPLLSSLKVRTVVRIFFEAKATGHILSGNHYNQELGKTH